MIQPPKKEREGPAPLWKPAPEADKPGSIRSMMMRIGILIGLLLAGYFIFTFVSYYFFQPHLVIKGVVEPAEPFGVDSPVRIGLKVSNERWADGSAYVVLAIEGETEVDGPVSPVPAREVATVMVEAKLRPGWRSGTLILYDAYRENIKVDARHGVAVHVGTTSVIVTDVKYAPTVHRGDTLTLSIGISNKEGQMDALLVPIVVVLSETGAEVAEKDGRSFALAAGADTIVKLGMPTSKLVPKNYFLTVIMTNPKTGQRSGLGKYHQPLTVAR